MKYCQDISNINFTRTRENKIDCNTNKEFVMIGMEFVRLSHRRPIEVSDVCRQNILQYFCVAAMLISKITSALFLNKDLS